MRNLVDFQNSVVGHLENFDRVAAYLAAGDNVVMLANHQTEADPGAHPLLPRSSPGLACRRNLPLPALPSGRLPCLGSQVHTASQGTLQTGSTQAIQPVRAAVLCSFMTCACRKRPLHASSVVVRMAVGARSSHGSHV